MTVVWLFSVRTLGWEMFFIFFIRKGKNKNEAEQSMFGGAVKVS